MGPLDRWEACTMVGRGRPSKDERRLALSACVPVPVYSAMHEAILAFGLHKPAIFYTALAPFMIYPRHIFSKTEDRSPAASAGHSGDIRPSRDRTLSRAVGHSRNCGMRNAACSAFLN